MSRKWVVMKVFMLVGGSIGSGWICEYVCG